MNTKKIKQIKKFGFTLLEMLVVIGIIAVLIGVGAVSYSTAQKKARDSKRQSDLKAIQNCMEQYYSTNSFQYQDLTSFGATLTDTEDILCDGNDATKKVNLEDPLDNVTYNYAISNPGTSTYTVTATLEGGGTFAVSQLQ